MNFSKFEKLFLAGLLLGIFVLTTLLITDRNSENTPLVEPIGKVRYRNHIAVRKYPGRLVWFDLKKEDDLYPNDTIQTGELSDAELVLPDNLILGLEARSLVQLEFKDGKLVLRLDGGGLQIAQGGSSSAEIKTANGQSIFLENANAAIRTDADSNETLVNLNSGEGRIQTGTAEATLENGSLARMGSQENNSIQIIKKEDQIKLISPADNQMLPAPTGKTRSVEFIAEKLEKDLITTYSLEIADNSSMQNSRTYRMKNRKLNLTLAARDWYWRVKVNGKDSYSATRYLKIREFKPIRLIYPPDDFILINNEPGERLVEEMTLQWKTDENYSSSRVILYPPDKLKPVHYSTTRQNSQLVRMTFPGAYRWVVENLDYQNQVIDTAEGYFRIEKNNRQPPNILNRENKIPYITLLRGYSLDFSNDQYKSYRIIWTKPNGATQDIFTNTSSYRIPENTDPGKHSFQIRGKLNELQESQPGKIYSLTIEPPPTLNWKVPQTITLQEEQNTIQIESGKIPNDYQKELSIINSASSVRLKKVFKGGEDISFKARLHGSYTFILKLVAEKKVIQQLSEKTSVNFSVTPVKSIPTIPKDWNAFENSYIWLRWPLPPHTRFYRSKVLFSVQSEASPLQKTIDRQVLKMSRMKLTNEKIDRSGTLGINLIRVAIVDGQDLESEPSEFSLQVNYPQRPQKPVILPGKVEIER